MLIVLLERNWKTSFRMKRSLIPDLRGLLADERISLYHHWQCVAVQLLYLGRCADQLSLAHGITSKIRFRGSVTITGISVGEALETPIKYIQYIIEPDAWHSAVMSVFMARQYHQHSWTLPAFGTASYRKNPDHGDHPNFQLQHIFQLLMRNPSLSSRHYGISCRTPIAPLTTKFSDSKWQVHICPDALWTGRTICVVAFSS